MLINARGKGHRHMDVMPGGGVLEEVCRPRRTRASCTMAVLSFEISLEESVG